MDNRWTYSRSMAVHSGELAPSAKALAKALTTYKKGHFSPLATPKFASEPLQKVVTNGTKGCQRKRCAKARKPCFKRFLKLLERKHSLQTLGCDHRVTQTGKTKDKVVSRLAESLRQQTKAL